MTQSGHHYTGDSTLLRRVNESAVLELIRTEGPLSRSDLARKLQLSQPTISRIVNPLIEAGLVIEGKQGDSSGGRRPILLELNHRTSLIIGVYLHQNMVAALTDLNGEILEQLILPAVPGEAGIQQLIRLIQRLVKAAERYGAPVRGVGIGIPSVTRSQEGTVVWAPVYKWRNVPLKQRLEESLNLSVYVENEVNLIALGENWRGAGQDVQDMVCISWGLGIGAGIILNGQLHRGAHDAAGEIGYIIPGREYVGRRYDDGYGCLEGLAGGHGAIEQVRKHLIAGNVSTLSDLEEITPFDVMTAAKEGDSVASAVIEEIMDYLSIAIANLVCVIDPEKIIIGGDLTELGRFCIDGIHDRLEGMIPVVPKIVPSSLGLNAPILGAVIVVMKQTSDHLFIHAQAQ
jgi:predicted NBD/HSP70 family sugar kinase